MIKASLSRTTAILIASSLAICLAGPAAAQDSDAVPKIEVKSPDFEHEKPIPLKFSAYGDNVSPKLTWTEVPDGAKQLALILDDPVAPMPQPFVHWVVYNIPASAKGLPGALPTDPEIKEPAELAGAIQGLTGLRRPGYFGPRPPADGKVHMYHFMLYALDAELNLAAGLNKKTLLEAIEGHVIGKGELIGTYKKED